MTTWEALVSFFDHTIFTMADHIIPLVIFLERKMTKEIYYYSSIFQYFINNLRTTYIKAIWKTTPKEVRARPANCIFYCIGEDSSYQDSIQEACIWYAYESWIKLGGTPFSKSEKRASEW